MARVQINAGMSAKEAKAFQKSIRAGLAKTAEEAYRAKLRTIHDELTKQRSECAQEAAQIQEQLDRAVAAERIAVAAAKRDKERAQEAIKAAKERVRLASENKRAKGAQKRRTCAAETEAIKARKAAEREHHAELRQIESYLKRRSPKLTSKERLAEKQDEVEQNIPAEYVPLWRKVRRTFHWPAYSSGKMSLTEAFLQYVHENPGDALAAQEDAAQADLARELRRKMKDDKAGERRRLSAEVPF